jgi:hypothetical protein
MLAMVGTVVFWLVLGVYVAGVLGPRVFWVVAGRRCPRCESGRLWFAGLADNPWRRLRSWWRCETCHAEIRETAWGRWESQPAPEAIEADLAA